MARARTNEIARLQSEITNEVGRDAPEIAAGIFGEAADMPDVQSVSNERLDELYRQKYQSGDRTWLQGEARRDPEQFLKIAERIGVQKPTVAPGMPPPPAPGAFARAAAAPPPPPALPAPGAPGMPPIPAAPAPLGVGPQAPAGLPVILGPNGQPLPPSGVV